MTHLANYDGNKDSDEDGKSKGEDLTQLKHLFARTFHLTPAAKNSGEEPPVIIAELASRKKGVAA